MQVPITSVLGLWAQEKGPLYHRLAQALRQAIQTAELPANTRLPAERVLARELGISRNTVVAAYNELEKAGLIERRHGSGTWVCSLTPQQAARLRAVQTKPLGRGPVFDAFLADYVDPIDLATGAVAWPAGLPVQPYLPTEEELSPLMDAYGYVPHGYQPLRQAIARSFTLQGIPTSADQVLVTTGAQQAILLIASCFLQRGDTILVESPTFFGALDAFRSLGLRCRSVPVDADGLQMERLRQQMAPGMAQWLYLAPTIHNPTGASLSIIQRRTLVRLAEQHGVTIIEDLTMADLRWKTPTLPPLATFAPYSGIISIGSLSKVVWGGMRIGWIRASSELISRLARFKAIQDLGSPLLSQVMAVQLLNDLATFSASQRQELQRNLATMEEQITHRLPSWTWKQPGGGLFLWLKLPRGDARELAQEALHHGVLVTPGPTLSADEQHTQYVRLSYVRSPAEIIAGLERLHEAWRCYEARFPKIYPGVSVTI